MNRIKKLVVHWSASAKDTTVKTIDSWHKKNGWRCIGYHRVILYPVNEGDGMQWSDLVKEGRSLDNDPYLSDFEIGAHTLGHNKDTVGICVIGSPRYPLHPMQKEALLSTLDILVERFKLEKSDVTCHRDYMQTQCPGSEIYQIVQEYKFKGVQNG